MTVKSLKRGSDPSALRPTLGGDSLPLSRERRQSPDSITILMFFERVPNNIKFYNSRAELGRQQMPPMGRGNETQPGDKKWFPKVIQKNLEEKSTLKSHSFEFINIINRPPICFYNHNILFVLVEKWHFMVNNISGNILITLLTIKVIISNLYKALCILLSVF